MSLDGSYDCANIFAKVLRGEAPAVKVFEDDEVLVMMDIFPQSQGHCLVVPKISESRNLLDFPAARLGALFERVQRVARAVVAALAPDGVIITQFNGAAAGQTVFHLHVHVIPRYGNLPLEKHHQGRMADMDVLKQQAARIAAALDESTLRSN
ncbi:MAG: HIT family protein [Alphaproteobacteria bacterium]|nr:HIT family protein [Alphaproteobacteria bacterium]